MLSILWRSIQLFLALAVPGSLIAGAIGGTQGALAWVLVACTGLIVLAAFSEKLLARAHGTSWNLPMGLAKTLECACARTALPIPRLGVFPSAIPTALALRSLGGRSTVLISQGLIALLPEEQLRAVLHRCAVEAASKDLPLRSLAAVIAFGVARAAPQAWSEVLFSEQPIGRSRARQLTARAALGFSLTFPPVRFLLQLSQSTQPAGAPGSHDDFFDQAVRLVQKHLLVPGAARHSLSVRSLCVLPSGLVYRPQQR